MSKLAIMQKLCDKEALRLDITPMMTVCWAGPLTCKLHGKNTLAHAHTSQQDSKYGHICVRRGNSDWRTIIKHEVAHFAPGGNSHGIGFLKARAKQNDAGAKNRLRRLGMLRCPKHNWRILGTISREITPTPKGLHVETLHQAECIRCGKVVPQ